jgi:hypothetical protein
MMTGTTGMTEEAVVTEGMTGVPVADAITVVAAVAVAVAVQYQVVQAAAVLGDRRPLSPKGGREQQRI